MRLQLVGSLLLLVTGVAHADDTAEVSTTWYEENRQGNNHLTVIHPQFDLGADLGETVTLALGYAADAVTGATSSVYSVDAVSSATSFSDLRHEANLSLGLKGKRSSLTATGIVGTERDYNSIAVSVNGAIDLPGKNTNVALSYTHNFDQVCDKDNADLGPLERGALVHDDPCTKQYGILGEDTPGMTVWKPLTIDTSQGTVTQNLSPTADLQLSLFGQVLHGFQSNPYRRVEVGANEPQESIPDTRGRVALEARINKFLPRLKGAVHGMARAYSDTWGVNSGTVELAYSQYMGSVLLLRFRARVYQQTPATFFKDAFYYQTESAAGQYFTGDRELSPVRNVLVGAKMTLIGASDGDHRVWGMFDKLDFNLKADILFLDHVAADPTTPGEPPVGDEFLTSNSLLGAFVLQAGLLGQY